MYIAHVEINNHAYGMPIRATKEVLMPISVTTEEEAVKHLTDRRYSRFTLYELREVGSYAPHDAPVVRVS